MKKGVLVAGYGGPEKKEDLPAFLDSVTQGKKLPDSQIKETLNRYEQAGGISPYNQLAQKLADGLCNALKDSGMDLPVKVGFRHTGPQIPDVIKQMQQQGVEKIAVVPLSVFQSGPGWEAYQKIMDEALQSLSKPMPELRLIPPWHMDKQFIKAIGFRIQETIGHLPPEQQKKCHWIFTAHSLPHASGQKSDYSQCFKSTSQAVASLLEHDNWSLTYQSRCGSKDSWLEPDVEEALQAAADSGWKDIVMIPIGFVLEHLEVLYDLDVKGQKKAKSIGLDYYRACAIGTHTLFIQMMSEKILRIFNGFSIR